MSLAYNRRVSELQSRESFSAQVGRSVIARTCVLLAFVGSMWCIRLLDTFRVDGSSIAGAGIVPRDPSYLTGLATAPFIHANWPHLIANTIPLLALGSIVLLGGVAEFVFVTIVCAVVGGFGTWLFGSAGHHIGASGVIFGYVGYLLARSAFDRRIWFVAVTVFVAFLYGSALVWSLVPRSGVSWSGHLFGFIGGVAAAKLRKVGE